MTLLYGFLWNTNLDFFPSWPGWMGRIALVVTKLDPWDTGAPEDFVFTYMMLVSFINVSLLTLAGWLIWRFRRLWLKPFQRSRIN